MLFFAAASPEDHVKDLILVGSREFPIITMHMVMLVVSGLLTLLVMTLAAKAIRTGPSSQGVDRYVTKGRVGQLIESIVVYLRDQMLVPVLGEDVARRFLPFLLSLFFFILFNNLLGIIPLTDLQHVLDHYFNLHAVTGGKTWFGGTATANIAVTAALAVFSFFAIQVHAIKESGIKGWLLHHCAGLVPGPAYLWPVVLVVFLVEVAGDFIKPVALAIRLFANMVAGHILLAVLLSFGAMAASAGMGAGGVAGITVASGVFALLIFVLELFVAFLQAFIFMFLTAVFISLYTHHDEHHEEHAHDHNHAHEPVAAHA